ncbi:MAG: hypothetical protein EOM91_20165 [Sphingobacteriia bacterium]|nr:hypothetical protein [Sphingobacteriia bacterium]
MTTRVYPLDCTSAYCGKGPESCPSCHHYPVLAEFNRWREETRARQSDPIWSPLVYVSTRPEGGTKP